MRPDTAPTPPTPAVAIGSKAVPQPAKAPTPPATGIGESKFTNCLETLELCVIRGEKQLWSRFCSV